MPHDADCPATEVLRHFLLGALPPEKVERLAEHVEGCARCVGILTDFKDSDGLLRAVQSAPAPTEEPPAGLVERACALQKRDFSTSPEEAGGMLARIGVAPSETTQELYDFLQPHQGPGELGRLGAYRILRVLGAGGMGVVFEAEDTDLKRRVALKVLRPALAASASARQRFLREGQAAAALSHEHVVPIFQVGEDHGVPFLTMPLLQGETLEERLRREPILPAPEALRIGREVALALAAAHAHGLIHRDIKPGNIFLTQAREETSDHLPPVAPGTVKLLDFGLARDIEGDAHITRSGTIVGTPAYMAPEQARGEPLDARCDLFSLGCLLYRLATGKLPFQGVTVMATLRALEMDVPRSPDAVNTAVPAALADLILRLLAKAKEERCSSASAVAEELVAIGEGRQIRSRRRNRRLGRAALLLGGLLLLAGIAFRFLGTPPPPPRGDRLPAASDWPGHFDLQVTYPVGKRPYAVVVGDVNGDGKLDLVTSNIDDNTVSVLLGNGNGTFQSARHQATEAQPHGLLLADVNGDGQLDLAVANLESGTLSVLLNAGDGNFARPVSYRTGKQPRTITSGDFNGDGKLDLAVVNYLEPFVSIFLGNGDGSFRPAIAGEAIAGAVVGLTAVDLDRNGTVDLVVSAGSIDALAVLLGKGDGTFQPPQRYNVGSGPGIIVAGDFNRDGYPDVAVENFGTHDVSVLLGNGDGTLRPAGRFAAGLGPGGLATGDFNGDGVLDLVVANHGSHNLSFLIGNGDGTFRTPDHRAAGGTPAGVAVGDFNGDGRSDIAVVNYMSHTVSVFLHRRPEPHFRLSSRYEAIAGVPYALAVTAVDARQNLDTGCRGDLRFHSSDPRASFLEGPMSMHFRDNDNGATARQVVLRTTGAQTWTATDVSDPTRQGSLTVVVLPGPPTGLRIAAPLECTAGKPFPITITALDVFDNAATSYTGTVHVTGTDAATVLPGPITFLEADGGIRRFDVTLHTAGSQAVTVTDTRIATITATARLLVRPTK